MQPSTTLPDALVYDSDAEKELFKESIAESHRLTRKSLLKSEIEEEERSQSCCASW